MVHHQWIDRAKEHSDEGHGNGVSDQGRDEPNDEFEAVIILSMNACGGDGPPFILDGTYPMLMAVYTKIALRSPIFLFTHRSPTRPSVNPVQY